MSNIYKMVGVFDGSFLCPNSFLSSTVCQKSNQLEEINRNTNRNLENSFQSGLWQRITSLTLSLSLSFKF